MADTRLKIFFSGIGGSGVSAIACFMADRGHTVFGSDRAFDRNPNHPVYKLLKSKRISIVPQDGSGIDKSFDLAVFSTAVEQDQPELLKAKELGIPVKTRPEYLSEIVLGFKTIAVAGTSGKSTTSGLLAFLMQRLGLNPNFIGGGRVKQFKTEMNPGNSITGDSDYIVIEACESDGTIVNYEPEHSIILNLDLDHHSVDRTAEMFKSLAGNTADKIILNADDNNLNKFIRKADGKDTCFRHSALACPRLRSGDAESSFLALDSRSPIMNFEDKFRGNDNIITFSIDNPSDYKADNIVYNLFSTDFSLNNTKFSLSIPGKYNLYNALSCIAMLCEMKISLKDIASVLHEFKGIERRFDIHFDNGKRLVIDDYAHNPHKITSLMQTMKNVRESICYIFQPHGFAPTKMMKDEYIDAFAENLRNSDHLILLPIFYAGGAVSKDISSHDLANGIRAKGKSVEVVDDRETILNRSGEWDNYVIFGARDETLSDFAKEIVRLINSDQQ